MVRYIFLLYSLFVFAGAKAQQTIIIPQQYEDKMYHVKNEAQIVFFAYPYVSENIDLSDLKKRYPKADLPKNIKIQPPNLDTYQDMTVLMTILPKEGKRNEQLLLWLVGNYKSNKAYFMVDPDFDRDFKNDGKPIVIRAGQKAQKVELKPKDEDGLVQVLWIDIPRRPDFIKQKMKQLKGVRSKMANKFAVGAYGGFGVGGLQYNYDDLTIGFPTWYSVNLTEKSIGLSFSYNHPYFRIEANAGYQNIFYYTSYLNIRKGEPEEIFNANTGRYVTVENVDTRRNLDAHPNHRLQVGLTGAARIHIGTYTEIQPFVSAGQLYFSPGEYRVFDSNESRSFSHSSAPYVEAGLRAEFAVGVYRSVFIESGVKKIGWKPDGFLDSVPHENLETRFRSWGMAVGYRIGI